MEVHPLLPSHKIHPDLLLEASQPERSALPRRLELALWPGESADYATDLLTRQGAADIRVRKGAPGQVRVLFSAAPETLEGVAEDVAVAWIERAPQLERRNNTTSWLIQSGRINVRSLWDHGLTGQGQVIGHLDGLIDIESCFFRDPDNGNIPGPTHRKIVAIYPPLSDPRANPHGTHTAGTLAGFNQEAWDATGSMNTAGIAYLAKIAFGDDLVIAGWGDLESSTLKAAFLRAQADGAYIHSNSWGDELSFDYTFWAQDVDAYMHENEDALVVFAASNQEDIHAPDNAKNCLTVGACLQYPDEDYHYVSGRGPTFDGRIKPDLMAPGSGIYSADVTTPTDPATQPRPWRDWQRSSASTTWRATTRRGFPTVRTPSFQRAR